MSPCCGGGVANNSVKRPLVPGEDGVVILEYIGNNDGDSSWFGSVTGTRYVMGGITTQAYVDDRDAPAFLELWEHGVKLFTQVVEPSPAPAEDVSVAGLISDDPVELMSADAIAVDTTATVEIVEEEPEPEPVVLLSDDEIVAITKRVADIEAWLLTAPPIEQVNQVYEYERSHSDRVTAVAALEEYLGAD